MHGVQRSKAQCRKPSTGSSDFLRFLGLWMKEMPRSYVMHRNHVWALSLAGFVILASLQSATAQGLILNLPKKEGAWVRFEGTVKQVEFRPDAAEGDISME